MFTVSSLLWTKFIAWQWRVNGKTVDHLENIVTKDIHFLH